MVFTIIYKWSTDFMPLIKSGMGVNTPSIIIAFSQPWAQVPEGKSIYGDPATQAFMFKIILLILFVCALVMIFPKPILIYRSNQKYLQEHHMNNTCQEKHMADENNDLNEPLVEKKEGRSKAEKDNLLEELSKPFGEIIIEDGIEAIEFILGSISNTASYLRLWALSLAHSQLAEVFFNLIMGNLFKNGTNPWTMAVGLIIGFIFVAGANMGVLMIMDFMECMLHCLRLHWVEFQNKFYKGDGVSFRSFNLEQKGGEEF